MRSMTFTKNWKYGLIETQKASESLPAPEDPLCAQRCYGGKFGGLLGTKFQ